jgi:hypothetical protein
MHLTKTILSFLILVSITFSEKNYAQEQAGTPILQEKPKELVTYKVSEIPAKLEEAK